MRLDGLRIRGLLSFPELVEVDFDKIHGLLVAVTGKNGEGKSTFLECIPGAFYRDTPTRGTLADLADARDAFVEVRAVNGAGYTIRQNVDGKTGKGDSIVLDENGKPILSSAKRSEFDVWARTHLPDPDVYFSSIFAAQRIPGLDKSAESFLSMKPAGRKGVLVRVLGIERVELMISAARKRAATARTKLEVAEARLSDERERSGDPAVTGPELKAAEEMAAAAQLAKTEAEAALEAARAAAEKARADAREREVTRRRRAELTERLGAVRGQLADTRTKIGNNRKVLADAETIRRDVTRATTIDAELGELGQKVRDAEQRGALADRDHDAAAAKEQAATQRAAAARARVKKATDRLGLRAEIDRAAGELVAARAALAEATSKLEAADAEVAQLGSVRLGAAHERVASLRQGLDEIARGVDVPEQHAAEVLEADDEVERAAVNAPKELDSARARLREAQAEVQRRQGAVTKLEQTAARRGEIAAAEEEAHAAQLDADREAKVAQDASDAMVAAGTAASEARAAAAPFAARRAELEVERRGLEKALKLADPLRDAEARLAELEPRETALATEEQGIATELAATPEPAPAPPVPDVTGPEGAARAAAAAAEQAARAVAAAEQRHAAALAAGERIAALVADRAGLESELADWTHLENDLEALKALEIDASGPELTEMTNDLLHTCHGPRWSASIETTRLDSKGKKQLEGCEVVVHDGLKGRSVPGERLSEGEGVIVGEAISLAFAMLGCRRTGLSGVTLVRDETGAALDVENARAYVAMLRRAAGMIGASKVLFVSHNPEVQALADARLVIASGRIEVA